MVRPPEAPVAYLTLAPPPTPQQERNDFQDDSHWPTCGNNHLPHDNGDFHRFEERNRQ